MTDLRHKYLIILFDNIFTQSLAQFDIKDDGYINFDEEILATLPCHQTIQKVMQHYYMKTIKTKSGEVVILGGQNRYNSNWWYTYFDADNVEDVFNHGTFGFEMAIDGEIGLEANSFKTRVEFIDFQLDNMYIDMDDEDVWLIKDGEYVV